jgi:hypothetical protein
MLCKDGHVIGVFQGLIRRRPLYVGMNAGSESGLGVNILPNEQQDHCGLFLREILHRERGFSRCSLVVPCLVEIPGFEIGRMYTFRIDLTSSLQNILKVMRKGIRWSIRIAQKDDVRIETSSSVDALRETWELVVRTARRRGFEPPSWAWVANLHEGFSRVGDSISILATHKGELVSAGYFIGYDRKLSWIIGGLRSTDTKCMRAVSSK